MKWAALIVVVALGVAAIITPQPPEPVPAADPGSNAPPVAVCGVDESSSRSTTVAVGSTVDGQAQLTVFAGGSAVGLAEFTTGTSGSASIPIDDVAAVGQAAALVEFPTADSAAASVLTGGGSAAAEICSQVPERQVIIGGGSTVEGTGFEVQLINPYSAEAVADIRVTSESGREENELLNSITVPPRDSVIVDMANVLPGRAHLVLSIETSRGSVVAVARSDLADDSAIWRAVAPGESWYAVVPSLDGRRELIVASGALTDVEYQIDVYGPAGIEEAAIEGVLSAGGQDVIDVSAFSEAPAAFRVIAAGPVAVFTRLSSNTGMGMTAGSPVEAGAWLLPGAGTIPLFRGRLVMVNVGLDVAEVTVSEVRDRSRSRVVTIEAGQVLQLDLDDSVSDGVTLVSDGLLVPMWVMRSGPAIAVSGGTPLGSE